ncbi:hypothetical protein BKA63DRAFT_555001 [Paraphoma chrysanthemicola]|nr:hypothetical protein BKA63DRAFT_555001 [Paraphoma chrysanthemicola]
MQTQLGYGASVPLEQQLPSTDYLAASNFGYFPTHVTTPWDSYGLPPSSAQPLLPYELESNYNLFPDAGPSFPVESDLSQPWAFATPYDILGAGASINPPANLPQAIAPPPSQPTDVSRHTCPVCSKTFKRAGDYRRHMKKHGPPLFKCCVMNCDKTFYRADKVRAHHRQGHKMNM